MSVVLVVAAVASTLSWGVSIIIAVFVVGIYTEARTLVFGLDDIGAGISTGREIRSCT